MVLAPTTVLADVREPCSASRGPATHIHANFDLAGFASQGLQSGPLATKTTPARGGTTKGQQNKLGNYHCNNRVYSIGHGRWLSPDQAASPFFNLLDYVGNHPTQATDPNGLTYESMWTKAQWEEFQRLRQQLKRSGLSETQAWAVAATIVDVYFMSGQKRDKDRSGYGLPNWSDILFPKKGQKRSGVGISSKRKDYEDEVLGRLRKESGDIVDMGCVGLATVRQGADSGKRRSTSCFTSISEATAHKCPDGDSPFIYAVQGHPKEGQWPPAKDESGKITKQAGEVIEVTGEGHFNFATYVNGLWEYMNQGNPAVMKDAGCSRREREAGRDEQKAIVSPELPNVDGWQTLYCVDCLID